MVVHRILVLPMVPMVTWWVPMVPSCYNLVSEYIICICGHSVGAAWISFWINLMVRADSADPSDSAEERERRGQHLWGYEDLYEWQKVMDQMTLMNSLTSSDIIWHPLTSCDIIWHPGMQKDVEDAEGCKSWQGDAERTAPDAPDADPDADVSFG